MGVRTRGLDIAIGAKRQVADAAARAEAQAVIERWNEQLVATLVVANAHPDVVCGARLWFKPHPRTRTQGS
jgi:hypothetical protein